jgi:hypothetical protein
MSTSNVIRARGYGPSTPLHDQALPGTGTSPSPPTDRKVARRDNGAAEEPRPREQNNAGGRQYILTLPAGEYEGEDDEQAGLTHVHRRDAAGRGQHVCSLPHDNYEIERDESGSHVYRVSPDDEARESEERRGEREERDQAMGHNVLPRAARLGRGRDLGPTEYQRLRAYKEHLSRHYDQYRNWIRERTS